MPSSRRGVRQSAFIADSSFRSTGTWGEYGSGGAASNAVRLPNTPVLTDGSRDPQLSLMDACSPWRMVPSPEMTERQRKPLLKIALTAAVVGAVVAEGKQWKLRFLDWASVTE